MRSHSVLRVKCMHFAVHGVEYAFGAHDYPTSGVFEVEPRQCPGFKFRRSILIGTTCLDPHEVREFMEQCSSSYYGDTYHLIVKNCNHFCRDVCHQLTGKSIPKWVNRLAKIGTFLSHSLLEAIFPLRSDGVNAKSIDFILPQKRKFQLPMLAFQSIVV